MRTIYIDSKFKCHVANDSTIKAIETKNTVKEVPVQWISN